MYQTRNVVETAIELSKLDKTSTWAEIGKKMPGKTWAELFEIAQPKKRGVK